MVPATQPQAESLAMPLASVLKKGAKLLNNRRKAVLSSRGRRDPLALLKRGQTTDFTNEQIVDTPITDRSSRREVIELERFV